MSPAMRRVLLVVMDGIGISENSFGNAVANAQIPNLKWLTSHCPHTTLLAHGKSVGLPSDTDIGNSEVGHNALGAGRVFAQGASLVQTALENLSIFEGSCWQKIIAQVKAQKSTLHLIGLLSDGNVHSHEDHLYALIRRAKQDGLNRVRIHALLDGRDVGEKSAEVYVERLERVINELRSPTFDIAVASGGGRMTTTMDRYNADWGMVERGWKAHVQGIAAFQFPSLPAALKHFRSDGKLTDQNIPAFVITNDGKPNGTINDHDAVIFFNFRGDRAIEISRSFTERNLTNFPRGPLPNIFFAGMMEYDGDLKIPHNYLVSPPAIDHTLGEFLANSGVRQFACSETQKFGHVTYFWNGNRSGYFNKSTEEYLEITSDQGITFDEKPWMKAYEITEQTIKRMQSGSFDFARINLANGDMVGHTGNYEAAVVAVETVDLMLGKLITAARDTGTILVVTADHGNADEMFDAKAKDFPNWRDVDLDKRPTPKTAHTVNPVPFAIFDPVGSSRWKIRGDVSNAGLGNVANTVLTLLGLQNRDLYLPCLIEESKP